jgi:hypothetical protein
VCDDECDMNRRAKRFQRLVLNLTALQRGVDKIRELFQKAALGPRRVRSSMELSLPGSVQEEATRVQMGKHMRKTSSSYDLASLNPFSPGSPALRKVEPSPGEDYRPPVRSLVSNFA